MKLKTNIIFLLLLTSLLSRGQVNNFVEIKVKGSINEFYPVVFSEREDVWAKKYTEIIISRTQVHLDGLWAGSMLAKFKFHTSRYGNGSNFIDIDLNSSVDFIADYKDGTGANGTRNLIVWLKGGGTTYFVDTTSLDTRPKIYDGVQNPIPFVEVSGTSTINHGSKSQITLQNQRNLREKSGLIKSDELIVTGLAKMNGGLMTQNYIDISSPATSQQTDLNFRDSKNNLIHFSNLRQYDKIGSYLANRLFYKKADGPFENMAMFSVPRIEFYSKNQSRLLIDSVGNVGIGNANPDYKLHVLGDLGMGSTIDNSYSKFVILGPNSPAFAGSKRDISFEFASAGKAQIRSYRGGAWDTYMQFLTTSATGGNPIERLHINGDGNIGIGNTNPDYKLHVLGDLGMGSTIENSYSKFVILGPNSPSNAGSKRDISFEFASAGKAQIRSYRGGSWDTYMQFLTTPAAGGNPIERLHINGDGNVGIGTESPSQKLEVNGGIVSKKSSNDFGPNILVMSATSSTNGLFIRRANTSAGEPEGTAFFSMNNNTFPLNLFLNENGSVAVGSTKIPVGYKLAVAGNVIAEKVKVKNSLNWPDFVFKKDYELPSLSDIEKYVIENSHLPEIPSAAEIEKDGQDLGEMNRLLLKKVEELTLYLIKQDKKIEKQTKDITELKSLIKR